MASSFLWFTFVVHATENGDVAPQTEAAHALVEKLIGENAELVEKVRIISVDYPLHTPHPTQANKNGNKSFSFEALFWWFQPYLRMSTCLYVPCTSSMGLTVSSKIVMSFIKFTFFPF